MVSVFYGSIFAVSIVLAAIYVYMWHKHFDVNLTMVFTICPIACLGYVFFSMAENLREVVIAYKLIYLGGCFLQLFLLLSVLNLCQIRIQKWFRCFLFVVCAVIYGSVLSVGYYDIFYHDIGFERIDGNVVFHREYGPMHTVFYVVVCLFFLAAFVAVFYSLFKKKQVPRTIIYLLLTPEIICVFSFFVAKQIIREVEFVPLSYAIAELMYLLIAYRLNLYNTSDTAIDSFVQEQQLAYISFDFKYRYLGSNETAKELIPELAGLPVDTMLGQEGAEKKLRHFLDSFRENEANNTFLHTIRDAEGKSENDKFYNVNVNYLYDGIHKRGYMVTFTDDTVNRKYIRLLDNYNENLKNEVEAKTKSIYAMHDNLIMSLAMMVESRDNSTGGHIKRTSEGVRILVDEILREGKLNLKEEFCRDVIKAAPMHDLGKIAVDDAVLRKPGRFTPEEFEKMKCHASEGARVIHEVLLSTPDNSFKKVAENVAHYHHERWDGSGYPEGLSGESIPLEARIMAIADVYDALVSKRVYKEAFDFDKADSIIKEGMGSQFDPSLRSAYENARPRLEEYYKGL